MIKKCNECEKQCLDYHHILEIRLNDKSESLINYEFNLLFIKCQKRIMEKIMSQTNENFGETHFEVVIRFLDEETATSAAERIRRDYKYFVHVHEVAT